MMSFRVYYLSDLISLTRCLLKSSRALTDLLSDYAPILMIKITMWRWGCFVLLRIFSCSMTKELCWF